MSDQTLISLAVLTVGWNHNHDAIESFVPIVAECLRKGADQPVSLVDLQAAVQREAGIKIPSGALQTILARCGRRGYVRRQDGVYHPQRKKLNKLPYATLQAEALRQHKCLVDKLQGFAKERHNLDWTEQQADTNLLGYLQEGSLPVLLAASEGDPLPDAKSQSRRTRHVLHSFAAHLAEADPDGFDCLVTVVKGHILSGVLFYPDIGQVETKFDELDVYCDTPFILRALGYNEEGVQLQCLDLIELLGDLGANLKIFHHTREEIVGVLEWEAAKLRPGSNIVSDPVDYQTSRQFTLTEVEEMIIHIDATLGKLGITVVTDRPDYSDEPDEIALGELLAKRIHYEREKTRERDVQSLAAIARLRQLRRMDRFEKAKAIFLTSNTNLARTSTRFFSDIEGPGAIPLCMPVEMMTRLAWVKKPMAVPNLPQHVVRASAYAAINPPVEVWRECLAELNRRREKGDLSDADYVYLRSSREFRKGLMDKTGGGERPFSAGTLDEVIQHAKSAVQAEADQRTEDERRQRLDAEERAEVAHRRAEGLDRVLRQDATTKGRKRGAAVGWTVIALITALFLLGVAAAIPHVPLIETKGGLRYFIWACLGVFIASNIATGIKGLTLIDLRRSISQRVETRIAAREHRRVDELQARARCSE